MWTTEAIDNFMNEFGFKPKRTKSEIKELPAILHPDEKLYGLLEGVLKKIHNREILGHGLVIATDKRIMFFHISIFGSVTKEEIPISKISSTSMRKSYGLSSISIMTAKNEAVVEQCDQAMGPRFADTVQKLISAQEANSSHVAMQANTQADANNHIANFELLEKLFELKQNGILTEEEYTAQKAKLLG